MRSRRKNGSGERFSQVRIPHSDTPRKWQSFWGASTRAQKSPCTFPRGAQIFCPASNFRAPPLGHLGASLFAKSQEKGGGPAIFWRGLLNNLSVSPGSRGPRKNSGSATVDGKKKLQDFEKNKYRTIVFTLTV